jgi:endonuclease/exonuclease/phosphatase family metal-dependent hydrolase
VVAATAGWLALVVAQLALSGRVWWWNLPDLIPPVLFAAVPVLLAVVAPLARPARWRILAALLVAAVLGWPLTGLQPASLWHRPPPVTPGAVTVFAWNTFYWDTPVDGPPDPDRLYRHLREQQADVYLLQEYLYFTADLQPIRIDHADRLSREFPGYQISVSGELITLSRFPIVAEQPLDLRRWLTEPQDDLVPSGTALPAYHTVKTLRTDLLVAGRLVSFYNAHVYVPVVGLPVGGSGTAASVRDRQDQRRANYRALTADLEANPNPVVLAGDLNSTSAMGLLRTLPDRLVDAGPATGSVYPVSWTWFGLPLWRLDWTVTSADVAVHRYRMVSSGGLSDHAGQHLTLSFPG